MQKHLQPCRNGKQCPPVMEIIIFTQLHLQLPRKGNPKPQKEAYTGHTTQCRAQLRTLPAIWGTAEEGIIELARSARSRCVFRTPKPATGTRILVTSTGREKNGGSRLKRLSTFLKRTIERSTVRTNRQVDLTTKPELDNTAKCPSGYRINRSIVSQSRFCFETKKSESRESYSFRSQDSKSTRKSTSNFSRFEIFYRSSIFPNIADART